MAKNGGWLQHTVHLWGNRQLRNGNASAYPDMPQITLPLCFALQPDAFVAPFDQQERNQKDKKLFDQKSWRNRPQWPSHLQCQNYWRKDEACNFFSSFHGRWGYLLDSRFPSFGLKWSGKATGDKQQIRENIQRVSPYWLLGSWLQLCLHLKKVLSEWVSIRITAESDRRSSKQKSKIKLGFNYRNFLKRAVVVQKIIRNNFWRSVKSIDC